ncbi:MULTISPECIES: hypothetical protein [unclassified Paenarthrobacter]
MTVRPRVLPPTASTSAAAKDAGHVDISAAKAALAVTILRWRASKSS